METEGRIKREGGKFRLIPKRAKIVREIFERYANGEGKGGIAAALNERGEPTWGAFGTGREPITGRGRKAAKFWHASYVHKLLRSPAAMGTWVPRSHGEDQKPIKNYFPEAVSSELYQRVAELIRSAKPPGRGNREIRNPLSGVARCPRCGDTLTRSSKGSRSKSGEPRLICVRAKAKKHGGCSFRSVRLSLVEAALRRQAGEIAKARLITDASLIPALAARETLS